MTEEQYNNAKALMDRKEELENRLIAFKNAERVEIDCIDQETGMTECFYVDSWEFIESYYQEQLDSVKEQLAAI